MTIYCPICNRSSDEAGFIGEFCEFCTADKLSKDIPEFVTLYQCRICERLRIGNTYYEFTNATLSDAVMRELHMKDCSIKVKSYEHKRAIAEFRCFFDGKVAKFEKSLKFKIIHRTCQECYKKSSGYYEALVQLRGDPKRISTLKERIVRYVTKRGAFIANIEEVPNGLDIYISDKLLANEFFHFYKLRPTRSYTLYGVKRGVKVYRNVYAMHL